MDYRIERLSTAEECDQFIINMGEQDPEVVREARRRAIELRAIKFGAATEAETAAVEAIYAYEQVLLARNGKQVKAHHTWRMIKKNGIIPTFEALVAKEDTTEVFQALVEMGMPELAYEAVVLRFPAAFSEKTVAKATERMNAMKAGVSGGA